MNNKTINLMIDDVKENLKFNKIGENNLDDNLLQKVNEISNIAPIEESVQTIQSSITTMQNDIDLIESSIEDVSAQITTLNTNTQNLQNEYLTIEGDVSLLNSNKQNKTFGANYSNKNVVTDENGDISTEDKPTIPTVNNGTLTIQRNGQNINTFTANSSTNVVANISVPVSASDVCAVSDTIKINNKSLTSNVVLNQDDIENGSSYVRTQNNFTNSLKTKLDGIQNGAQVNNIASITLNGSSTSSPSFYAPTSAGNSGQVLKSNGSGAPSWQNVEGGIQIVDNLTSTSASSALSANQGNVLNGLISSKANANAGNLTSANVTSWHNMLNNLSMPSLTDSNIYTNRGQTTVIETYLSSDKKTWYRKWSDGWKECGFTDVYYSSWSLHAFALPITFSNKNYVISISRTANGTGTANVTSNGVYSKTNSSFSTYADSGYKLTVYCCGF